MAMTPAEEEEFLTLFKKLPGEEREFFIHWMRADAAGYQRPDDFLERFWTDYFEQWKQGVDPFAVPKAA